jgi:hypothetical protein
MVIARAISFAGGAGSRALQGGVTFQAPTTGWYTFSAEVRYSALAQTFGIAAISTTSIALTVNGQVYGDIIAGGVSVPIPVEWLEAAINLYDIASALHEILQGPQAKTYVVTRRVRLQRGQTATVYAGVTAKTSAVGSFAAGLIGGEVRSISVIPPTGGSGRLQVRVTPALISAREPTTVTVHAEDALDHTPILGVVKIRDLEVGCTGVPFTMAFDCPTEGTVTAPSYPVTRFSFDVRDCRLQVSATPREIALNQPVQVTVFAKDATTQAPVAGEVKVNGGAVAGTNTPFTYTFRPVRRRFRDPDTGQWVETTGPPSVTVGAPRYREAVVDVRFR